MSILETIRQPKQRKLLMSAGLSWMFDAMDVGMLSFIIADLSLKWQLSPNRPASLQALTRSAWSSVRPSRATWRINMAENLCCYGRC